MGGRFRYFAGDIMFTRHIGKDFQEHCTYEET